ncbi:MAG: xanthine dehydrogenase family protein subunit M [Candidatus Eisenbacteria bacterium]
MPIEVYRRASSTEEAVRLRGEEGADSRYVAGGTDLLCEPEPPRSVIDVKRLSREIRREGDRIVIGAGVTVTDLLRSDEIAAADGGLLRSSARDFASWQIRNMATVGGNLASAVPSADLAPPFLVLNADVVALGAKGTRTIAMGGLFEGPHRSALGPDLLVEVRFAAIPSGTRTAWAKMGRTEGDIAVVSAAAYVRIEEGVCAEVRLALGAAAPTPIRVAEAERFLEGKPPSGENLRRASEIARDRAKPIDDQRASAAYRRRLSGVLTRRVLEAAAGGDGR